MHERKLPTLNWALRTLHLCFRFTSTLAVYLWSVRLGEMKNCFCPHNNIPPTMQYPAAANVSKDNVEGGQDNIAIHFNDSTIRSMFIQKVFLIVTAQLCVVSGVVALFTFNLFYFFSTLAIALNDDVRRRYPMNFVLLGILTVSLAIMAGTIASMVKSEVVMIAATVTCLTCLLVSLLAAFVKFDLTELLFPMYVIGIGLCVYGLVLMFFHTWFGISDVSHAFYSLMIIIFFLMYLAIDIQLIMGNKKYSLSPEEYILAAMLLYVDIINIFINYVSLLSNQPPYYNSYYVPGQAPPAPGWHAPPPPQQGWQQPPPPGGQYGYSQGGYPPYPPYPQTENAGVYSSHPAAENHGEDPKFGFGFSDKSIRQGFIRKVFLILTAQLMVVTAMVAMFTYNDGVKGFVRRNLWTHWLALVTFLVTYIVIGCCNNVRRRYPGNIICLAVLTLALGYITGTTASFYDSQTVILAILICCLCCGAVVIFSMQTKYDFTACLGVVFMLSMGLFLFGILATIFTLAFRAPIVHVVYAGFAAYLAIDVQMVVGGKRFEISPEDYVFAAVQLLVDIVYIFLYLLEIIGYSKKNRSENLFQLLSLGFRFIFYKSFIFTFWSRSFALNRSVWPDFQSAFVLHHFVLCTEQFRLFSYVCEEKSKNVCNDENLNCVKVHRVSAYIKIQLGQAGFVDE
ncbi:Protein lifeguard 1 [Trichinella nativa]|uniref:Protein lifeguard 1 n=1 Tax=Trichinella nativa TaxID=6335 RepID=A0A0V1LKB4_9BILA|nr:Protein lifeguard 1 [Trichinella nativa]